MSKDVARVWEFASASNPNKKHEALQYTDGSTSCNCMGWTRKVAADGTRTCRHVRMIDMGTADQECSGQHDYTIGSGVAAVKAAPNLGSKRRTKKKTDESEALPTRRVMFNRKNKNK